MTIKRKRGRPPKNKVVAIQEPVIVKRKRGRPPKNKAAIQQASPTPTKRRGRPPKNQSLPKAKDAKPTSSVTANETHVVGKLFTHSKHVSKQEEWFADWDAKCWRAFCQKDWENLILYIQELQNGINRVLRREDSPKLSIHIPVVRLMQDDTILKMAFDPINKGVDVHIFYRSKDFPLGLSPSMKATAVCNKVTELIKSFVPVGISG